MNGLGHIVRKDLRRYRLPAGLWLAFSALATSWFGLAPWVMGEAAADALGLLKNWSYMTQAMSTVIGYLLAGALVIEDPAGETSAFWRTRPISRGRMFGAKLVSCGILFVAAPVLALVVVWLAFGFSGGAILAAASDALFWYAVMVFAAVAIASVSPDLPRFLFSSMLLVLVVAIGGLLAGRAASIEIEVDRNSSIAAGVVFVAAACGAAAAQFLRPHTMRAWGLVAGGLLGSAAVLVNADTGRQTPTTKDAAVPVRPLSLMPLGVLRHSHGSTHRLAVASLRQSETSPPWTPVAAAGEVKATNGNWRRLAAAALTRLPDSVWQDFPALGASTETRWELPCIVSGDARKLEPGRAEFRGSIEVVRLAAVSLATLRDNARTAATDGVATRIVSLEYDERTAHPATLIVAEREPVRPSDAPNAHETAPQDYDAYVLRRPAGSVVVLESHFIGAAHASSIAVRFRRLALPEDLTREDLARATITRCRLSVVERGRVPVSTGIEILPENSTP